MSENFSLNIIQEEHREWANKNFPNNPPYAGLLGVVEEVGELAHAYLKNIQKIRGNEEQHKENMKDAVGDITIFLIDFCNVHGFNYQDVIEETWNLVKKRNWTDNKNDGVSC